MLTRPQIAGKDNVKIADYETTGENKGKRAFPSESAPKVCAVVVDKNSEEGFVEITGGGFTDRVIKTGPKETGFEIAEIRSNQGCMIYGCSTVLYICPRT